MEFFCASDLKHLSGVNSYRSFRFHRFRKFWHLVDGVFHFACFSLVLLSSAERYQVHQEISLVIGKSDEFFGLGMNLNRNIFTHFPIYRVDGDVQASFIMHKTFQAGCLSLSMLSMRVCACVRTCLYATIKQPVWARVCIVVGCANKKWKYMKPASVWIVK